MLEHGDLGSAFRGFQSPRTEDTRKYVQALEYQCKLFLRSLRGQEGKKKQGLVEKQKKPHPLPQKPKIEKRTRPLSGRAIVINRKLDPSEDPTWERDVMFSKARTELVLSYNSCAMKVLRDGNPEQAIKLLRCAEKVCAVSKHIGSQRARMELEAITLNNLGCVRKKQGKHFLALHLLFNALGIEERYRLAGQTGTHVNISVLLSSLNHHHKALKHCKKALYLIEQDTSSGAAQQPSSLKVLALYNMGMEYEHLHQPQLAISAYTKALQETTDESLVAQIRASIQSVSSKLPDAP